MKTANSSKPKKNYEDLTNMQVDKVHSYLMNNPIDNYFSPKFKSITEAEVREAMEDYEKVWKNEYNKVIGIIEEKCIYDDDKENLEKFKDSVESLIETATPVIEMEMLDNYSLPPDSPEKHSWGNSTYYYLEGRKGQIYRDACMLLIPFLVDEYEFPDLNKIKE